MLDVPMISPTPFDWLWLIPALPFLGALINGTAGAFLMRRFGPAVNHTIAILLPTGSFIIAVVAFGTLVGLPEEARALHQNLFQFLHVGLLDADMAFWFDPLSATMTLIITFIGTLIHVYSIGYMRGDDAYWRFFAYLNLFMGSMLMLVLGDNFLVMFIGWEGVGLCSYLLIAFWYKDKANAVAGMKAFIVNRVGDFGFIIGIALLFWGLMGSYGGSFGTSDEYSYGLYGYRPVQSLERTLLQSQSHGAYSKPRQAPPTSMRFEAVRARVVAERQAWDADSPGTKTFAGVALVTLICLFLFLGATGKSAQIPLYVWLPDAMAGPTPVSALIHAATMVTAGVYMVARLNFLFALSPVAMTVVAVVGAVTALYAATIGLFQYDIKKVLAYSTVSQLGYMVAALGAGAYTAGLFHLWTHAFFKGLLFLGAGSVIHSVHSNNMSDMGGLRKTMPITFGTFVAGTLALAGIFPFAGFFSKDEILAAFNYEGYTAVLTVGIIGAFITAFYMGRTVFLTFFGTYKGQAHPHESPRVMTVPMVILAALAVVGGWVNIPGLYTGFTEWVGTRAHTFAEHHAESFDWPVLAIGMTAALLGLLGGYLLYFKDRETQQARDAFRIPVLWPLLEHKYYLDDLYLGAIVNPIKGPIAQFVNWTNSYIIDGIVNGAGFLSRAAAGVVYGWFDQRGIDLALNGIAFTTDGAGGKTRLLQTGKVQQYAGATVIGAALLVIGFVIFR